MDHDDRPTETPPVVIGSIALGVGPLPFLGVYAVLFIAHGMFYPVQPPDITKTRAGEAVAGIVVSLLALLVILTIWWFLDGRRRWPFVIIQLATFGTALDFVLDSTTGSPAVPILLLLTSGIAVVLAFWAPSWAHVGATRPALPRRTAKGGDSYVGRRRPGASADVEDTSEIPA